MKRPGSLDAHAPGGGPDAEHPPAGQGSSSKRGDEVAFETDGVQTRAWDLEPPGTGSPHGRLPEVAEDRFASRCCLHGRPGGEDRWGKVGRAKWTGAKTCFGRGREPSLPWPRACMRGRPGNRSGPGRSAGHANGSRTENDRGGYGQSYPNAPSPRAAFGRSAASAPLRLARARADPSRCGCLRRCVAPTLCALRFGTDGCGSCGATGTTLELWSLQPHGGADG